MFVITLNKKKITKIAAAVVCVVAVGAVGIGIKNFFLRDSAAVAVKGKVKLETTLEMVDYISQKGFTADMQTAQVSEVQIPKKFDDSFKSFNEKIKMNDGLSLEKYKGDKVNKWTFEIIGYDEKETKAVAVLLLRKQKLVGAYILEKPDGKAVPMIKKSKEEIKDTSAVTEITEEDGMPIE